MPWHVLKSSARRSNQSANKKQGRILVFFQQGGKTKPLAKTRGTCVVFVVQLTANASICFGFFGSRLALVGVLQCHGTF